MRMMDELKHLFLYSSKKKVYVPIDEMDKRKNSAVLLLSPNAETSIQLTKMPYLYNPNLFKSYYIDRNVDAYIKSVDPEVLDFDEQEEEILSESLFSNDNVKFKIEDGTSYVDRKCIDAVYTKNIVKEYKNLFGLRHLPSEINIKVYPNKGALKKDAPDKVAKFYKDGLYSYSIKGTIHLISKMTYDERRLGPYDKYLLTELITYLICNDNNKIPIHIGKAIGYVFSGLYDWIKNEDDNDPDIYIPKSIEEIEGVFAELKEMEEYGVIKKFIKTANIRVLGDYYKRSFFKSNKDDMFMEGELSYFERQRLLPSEFGIPDKRKYPMPDKDHVKAAIQMFNKCDPEDEKELADNIIKKIKKFDMVDDVHVGASNRFKKYFDKFKKSFKEGMNLGEFINTAFNESAPIPNDSKYNDILKICDNLSDEEFKRISFYDTYKDSKFVIHRIVRKVNDEPVAFLDLYQFPSRPDIAQITLAVDENHRGLGLADGMVKELLNAGLPEKYGFKTFYWTAHENNKASMGLALKNGFIDTKELDKYGRRIFIRPVSVEDSMWNDVPENLKPNSEDEYTVTENALVSNNMAFFSEVDGSMYSTNLKRYLYKERLKNNKEVLRLYDDVKAQQPDITKTYVKLEMYRKANVFIDLSYYNSLFLKNLNYKLDRGVNFYFEFMNRLINNPTVTSEYKMRTVFIPIDSGVWGATDPVTLWDYRKNINPISVIFRLLKSNPSLLKKEFGKNNIIFVGSRGYFKIDFKQLDLRDLNRLKKNITKLMSFSEPIEDEYESDDVANDDTEVSYGKKKNNSDSSKAMAMNMIDKIEKGTSIKLNNVSPISQKGNAESTTDNAKPLSHIHLRVTKEPLQFGLGSNKVYDGSTAIISLDPAGSDNFKKLFDRNGIFKNIKNVNTYCIPK